MSSYYNGKRNNNLYVLNSSFPYKLSRTKIESFISCPRCFYIDRRLGIDRPPGFPFSLNSAVDKLLKKEFDVHRTRKTRHPLMEHYGIDAIPASHELLEEWRNPFSGIQFLHKPTNFLIFGGVDDIWQDSSGKLIVVDYKATSKDQEVNIDAQWQQGYKRQMEIYKWLFRQNGFDVSNTAYFVYCNGITDKAAFDGKLEFDVKIIPYKGDYSWVEKTLHEIKDCLDKTTIPAYNENCDYCVYRKNTQLVEA